MLSFDRKALLGRARKDWTYTTHTPLSRGAAHGETESSPGIVRSEPATRPKPRKACEESKANWLNWLNWLNEHYTALARPTKLNHGRRAHLLHQRGRPCDRDPEAPPRLRPPEEVARRLAREARGPQGVLHAGTHTPRGSRPRRHRQGSAGGAESQERQEGAAAAAGAPASGTGEGGG
eukprot:scaffold117977_cov75-Phaeocystis_antarctica.AAC.1